MLVERPHRGNDYRVVVLDIICDDIAREADGQDWVVLEVNAAPGLDNYASLGEAQRTRVDSLYRKVLLYPAAP